MCQGVLIKRLINKVICGGRAKLQLMNIKKPDNIAWFLKIAFAKYKYLSFKLFHRYVPVRTNSFSFDYIQKCQPKDLYI